jgi:hypothetical protein
MLLMFFPKYSLLIFVLLMIYILYCHNSYFNFLQLSCIILRLHFFTYVYSICKVRADAFFENIKQFWPEELFQMIILAI